MYLAAVSGGADSTAMLVSIASVFRRNRQYSAGFLLRCLHVEHGIRPPEESAGDAEYVQKLCESLNIPCTVVTIPRGKIALTGRRMGIGLEAAARHYRMRALNREARRLEADGKKVRVLTAHTRDDLLETTLMRILRGSGPAGLAAMPHIRGRFQRPLLGLCRRDVLEYLREKDIPWREDSSNRDTRFLRNRLRHRLVPVLNENFPRWQAALSALSETQSFAAAFIKEEAGMRVTWQVSGPDSLSTPAAHFFAQSAIIREEALFQCIDLLLAGRTENPVKRVNVRRFCRGLSKAVDLGPCRVYSRDGRVVLQKARIPEAEQGFSLLIKEPGLYTLNRVTIEVTEGLDSKAMDGRFFAQLPLVLRQTIKGDCIVEKGKKIAGAQLFRSAERKRLISAADRRGIAAFIGPSGLLACSGLPTGAHDPFTYYSVTIKMKSGGFYVQQSK